MTYTTPGQFGPVALQAVLKAETGQKFWVPIVSPSVTVPTGYTPTIDALGNLTIVGPPAKIPVDAYSGISKLTATPMQLVVQPAPSELDSRLAVGEAAEPAANLGADVATLLAAKILAGSGVTRTVAGSGATRTFTFSAGGGGLTEAQIAALFAAGSGIAVTYDSTAHTVTVALDAATQTKIAQIGSNPVQAKQILGGAYSAANNSATLVAVDAFTLTVPAGRTLYAGDANYRGNNAAGLQMQVVGPSDATYSGYVRGPARGVTTGGVPQVTYSYRTSTIPRQFGAAAGSPPTNGYSVLEWNIWINSVTGGPVTFQIAQATATDDTGNPLQLVSGAQLCAATFATS